METVLGVSFVCAIVGCVSAETLEVAFTPIFNNYRGSEVRGNKRFELHLVDLKQI